MRKLYLALAALGTAGPLAVFAPWLAVNGLDIPRLVREMFATEVSSFFSVDVLISALAVLALVRRGVKRGVPLAWVAALGTVTVGVSLGLPLYLYLEARHEAQQGGAGL